MIANIYPRRLFVDYRLMTCFINYISALFADPCLVHYCGRGEECVALGGVARCICVRKCGQAKRRVCGTDGQLYDNRCELHKAGCLTGVNIEIDHSLKCFMPSGEFKIKSKYRQEVST